MSSPAAEPRHIVLHKDPEREVRLAFYERRQELRYVERRFISGAWVEVLSVPVPLGLFVYKLQLTRQQFVEALQQDAARYGFRIGKRDWGRVASGAA